jgi:hypothetical protein
MRNKDVSNTNVSKDLATSRINYYVKEPLPCPKRPAAKTRPELFRFSFEKLV